LLPDVITVNPWHWLKENGSLPEEPRLRKQALLVAQCIEYGGPLPRGHARETLIACRRKLNKKPCPCVLCNILPARATPSSAPVFHRERPGQQHRRLPARYPMRVVPHAIAPLSLHAPS